VKLGWLVALALALAGGTATANPGRHPSPAPKKDPAPPPEPPAPPEPHKPLPPPGDPRRIVAILDVHVGEGVPADLAAQFQRDLDAQIDPAHYWLAPRSQVRDLMTNSTKWTDGCVVGKCLTEIKAQTGADVALIAAFTGSGTSFGSVITVLRTDTGAVIDQGMERCDVCTLQEALAAAEHAAVKLLDGLPAKLPDPGAAARLAISLAKQPLVENLQAADRREHRHRAIGTGITVAGLAIAIGGAVLYAADHHSSYGVGIAGAGGGLALGGVAVLAF